MLRADKPRETRSLPEGLEVAQPVRATVSSAESMRMVRSRKWPAAPADRECGCVDDRSCFRSEAGGGEPIKPRCIMPEMPLEARCKTSRPERKTDKTS